jgi:ribosomal protein S1
MWEVPKQRFPAGRIVRGTVTAHRPFGIFVDLGDPVATGLVQITEFLDNGRMTPEQYPAIGETVTAMFLGHTDEGRKQVWLCMRPSILQSRPNPALHLTRRADRLSEVHCSPRPPGR